VPVYSLAFAGTHCAYPWRDDQDEYIWVAGSVLRWFCLSVVRLRWLPIVVLTGSGEAQFRWPRQHITTKPTANLLCSNMKCGRRVRPTCMPPAGSNDTGTALGQDGSDWSRDLATLTFDLGGHGTCGWCGSSSSICVPSLKFVGLAIRKIRRTMCVSINGPGDLDLWPFDLETGVQVASKVGNLPSKFGHARSLGSRIIHCVRAGQTDGQTLIVPCPMT